MAAIPDIDVHENGDTLLEFQDQSSRRRSGTTWGIDRIDSRSGTDGSYNGGGSNGGAGVHVYILDTGVRASHNDFGGRGVPTLDATSGSGLQTCSPSSTTCSRDAHGHGTHCGGTTSGSTLGVAKASIVHGCKVLSDSGSGYTSWITGSLDWVVTSGPKPAVASMSLGGPGTSSTYRRAIDAAVNAGVVVVVAAGNENTDACTKSPAFVPNAITVGATDSNDRRASFSNYGSCVDLFAPGKHIVSASKNGGSASTTLSGTSMACPHVSGVVAVLMGQGYSGTSASSQLMSTVTSGAVSDTRGTTNKFLYISPNGGSNPNPTPTPSPSPSPPSYSPTPTPSPSPSPSPTPCPSWCSYYPTDTGCNGCGGSSPSPAPSPTPCPSWCSSWPDWGDCKTCGGGSSPSPPPRRRYSSPRRRAPTPTPCPSWCSYYPSDSDCTGCGGSSPPPRRRYSSPRRRSWSSPSPAPSPKPWYCTDYPHWSACQ